MDHATVLRYTLETVENAKRCRVIAVGGSYSGFLALAFRLRYPKLVYAAYASSSPGRLYSQEASRFDGRYYSRVTDAADSIRSNCSNSVIKAFDDFVHRYAGRVTFEQAKNELKICNPEVFGREDGLFEELVQMVRMEFSGANMASYPPSSNSPTYMLCTMVEQSGIAGIFEAMTQGRRCVDVTQHLPSPNKHGVYSASCGDWTGCGVGRAGRSWDWQTCTQLVEHISSYGPPSDMFPPRRFSVDQWLNAYCEESFGNNVFHNFSDTTREHRLNDLWGFDEATLPDITSRVLFVNGGMDGWTAGAVTRNLSDTIISLMIPSGAHHSEMKDPSDNDTSDMIAARDQIDDILSLWLGSVDLQEAEEAEAYEVMI
ncbi:Dipeptidyl-peptidase 2 precursor, putative [Perkinsus marinus ATCC 50983]|uniref:Dipeptidyl-peptidase 2, putative n=1 Tax=Perkinsus marinus (strain ATCC 50983 / TXsc) TaxID=423536 RepID=C5LJV6_PERM5|nr:Dipeptidyl-peptidase 2 precursor, putative [Perkinsus marinus ATCC 50983]EER02987.1 Dipeptidyl-peptidase 2 precursor, putative [Perkinsus marinus ATCC 50983]|eukprot:XP_002771171.1 Dipeptidyl-peptidase 2 precursor, putative [Perkinsus marinus ATCC 50983]